MPEPVQSSWADEIEEGDASTLPAPTEKVKGDTKSAMEKRKLPRGSWLSVELLLRIISCSDVRLANMSSVRISLVFIMI